MPALSAELRRRPGLAAQVARVREPGRPAGARQRWRLGRPVTPVHRSVRRRPARHSHHIVPERRGGPGAASGRHQVSRRPSPSPLLPSRFSVSRSGSLLFLSPRSHECHVLQPPRSEPVVAVVCREVCVGVALPSSPFPAPTPTAVLCSLELSVICVYLSPFFVACCLLSVRRETERRGYDCTLVWLFRYPLL